MFGVRYHTLYWAEKAVPDETLIPEHRAMYLTDTLPARYWSYFHIPFEGE